MYLYEHAMLLIVLDFCCVIVLGLHVTLCGHTVLRGGHCSVTVFHLLICYATALQLSTYDVSLRGPMLLICVL